MSRTGQVTPAPHAAPIRIVPANEASAADLAAIFGTRGTPSSCQCQWLKTRDADWKAVPADELTQRLREQTHGGNPGAPATTGLVAYVDGEPTGWCAVEPRTAYPRLAKARIPWGAALPKTGTTLVSGR